MKLKKYSLDGKSTTITVSDELFNADVKPELVTQAVHVYRSNQRQGGASTLRRGEVRHTGAKIYRQKGTGNARHGAKTAPIFVGGGIAHGPTGFENWKKSLPTKMARKATVYALTMQAVRDAVSVVTDLDTITAKTKDAAAFIAQVAEANQKVLLVIDESRENVVNAFSNVANVSITRADRLNALEVAQADTIVVMQPALDRLEARLLNNKDKASA
ncbi:50S ribosomal protein L4 [Candidatus Woesebacteria bacterium]|nr:50S ribosomal protein L4 [Candidatus Woesebacteria bacterium]MCD8507644.1 50S ribosomal protein L4 [Candidatus Woesebacteria bacterium]MCD8526770.1 50S ribosomal protein L4 [Candidatus Woesebacteria bacterium]MCD8546484.1 50S ribosomal protein L4 [Candidatus Woesebacteria bacterium]